MGSLIDPSSLLHFFTFSPSWTFPSCTASNPVTSGERGSRPVLAIGKLSPIARNVYCEGQRHSDGYTKKAVTKTGDKRPKSARASFDAIKCADRTEPHRDQDQRSVVSVFDPITAGPFSVVPLRGGRRGTTAQRKTLLRRRKKENTTQTKLQPPNLPPP